MVTPEELRAHDLESSPDTDDRQIEQTLTRRQLREMREAAESRMVEVSPIVEPGSLFTPFVKATRESTVESTVDRTVDRTVDSTRESVRESAQSAEIAAAMAEFDNLYSEPHEIPALIEPPRESLRFEEPRRFEPVAAPLAEPELTAVVPKPIVKDQPGAAVELTPVFEPMVEDDPELAFEPMEEVEPEFAFHADVQHESDYEFEPRDEDEPKFEFEPLDEHEQVDQHDPRFEFEPQLDGGAARASGFVPEAAAPLVSPDIATPPVIPAFAENIQSEPLREIITAPEVYSAPVGHWSNQSSVDDSLGTATSPHQRNIASSDAITTSALVLPSFPFTGPITGPVSGTGEILVTGTIELPRSLGVNGLHPSRYDRADIDSIIDAGDREDSAPDSAPVRAVRAVSTYTSSQGIISTKRPKGSNMPMILSITAGVMMVGVVVLVVAGMIFKIF
ncbi:MAG: hypothetical protein ABI238_07550 [Terrimesophilobacter sp.]